MRFRLRILLLLAATLPAVLSLPWNMPAVGLATNCGGNSAALAYVRTVTITMIMFAEDSANKTFSLETATPAQMRELVACSVGWNVRDGDIWVATKPLRLEENDEPRIVAVCSRPFRNVPQYMIRQAPPRHAVAFSDGSTALISAGGFEALDRSSFKPVNKVVSAPK